MLFALAAAVPLHAQPAFQAQPVYSVAFSFPGRTSLTWTNPVNVTGVAVNPAATNLLQVYVSLNGGAYQAASVTGGRTGHIQGWSLGESLAVGTNTISAYAADASGVRSPVVSHALYYAVPASVTVTVSGAGTVAATNLFNLATATSLTGTNFLVGRHYTLTATASHQNLFAGWINNTDGTSWPTNRYVFTAEANLQLTANFVTNRFLAVAGTYYGLFGDPVNGVSETSSGWFRVRLTPGDRRQAFSASLFVDGDTLGVSGAFDPMSGSASVPVARKGKAPLAVTLQLNFDGTITGTVSDPTDCWIATMEGNLSVYSYTHPSPYAGTYNLLIPGFPDPATGPAGYGFAIVKVATNGMVTAYGSLADGQPFSPLAAAVSTNGDWPVYAKAYKYGFSTGSNLVTSYAGAAGGFLNFGAGAPQGDLYWVKKGWTNGYYNGGFSNQVIIISSAVTNFSGSIIPPGWIYPNGLVTLSGGDLTSNVVNRVLISNTTPVAEATVIGKPSQLQRMIVIPSLGAVAGIFTNPATRSVELFKGLYLPEQNLIGGYFLGADQGGSLLVTPSDTQYLRTTNRGTVTITGYTGPGGLVVIPPTLGGLPVTGIGARAFWNNHAITGLVLPDSVTGIGDYAFYSCANLKSVALGQGVASIGNYAFVFCSGLTAITLPDNVTSVGAGAFDGCGRLVSVTLGRGVNSLGVYAFYNCPALMGVFFQGNAPASVGSALFTGDSQATVYYWSGTTGWGATFGARPAVMLVTAADGMVFVPGGAFIMGDALDGLINASPAVSVTVSAFGMDTNLVGYGQWLAVYNWAAGMGYGFDNAGAGPAAAAPVQSVNWYDAVKWCNARSQQAGYTPAYYTDAGLTQVYMNGDVDAVYVSATANGYRLPTEAQWEKAARGGLARQRFPWGNLITESQANYFGNTGIFYDSGPDGYNAVGLMDGTVPYTSPTGSFAPNGFGLSDMAGNVFEWCWDWYGTGLNGRNDYPANSTDPAGPASGSARVMRGGSWNYSAGYARCAARSYNSPGGSFNGNIGFRCVRKP
jgi:formylglycine-generating enzyme